MKVISHEQLDRWLADLLIQTAIVAPVKKQGKVQYQEINDISQIVWDFTRPELPPRNWVIPMTEPILFIEQGAKTILKTPEPPHETILFGLRPCDAKSFKVLDALFLDKEPADPQYARHRQSLTLIGLACSDMWDSCFCTVVGGAPDETQGLDILLTRVDDGFIVETITDKGQALISQLDLTDWDGDLVSAAETSGLPKLHQSSEWAEVFKDVFWDELSHACLSCRVCSFVCPTCRCYDVRDEVVAIRPDGKVYERLRAWDTCTSTGYRRIAGGHNPRETQVKRLKNRFYCKFMYYPEDFGVLGCVGCGRCIEACPSGIDILEVVEKVDLQLAQAQI